MEIEHINDDTIRVRIENDDLEARGYTFLDLLGNQKQIETFFYSILEEVDIDDEFQESDAVTFQVIPNRNGIELVITKNSDMHENFLSGSEIGDLDDSYYHRDYSRFENNKTYDDMKKEDGVLDSYESESDSHEFVVEFKYFEQIIQLAKIYTNDTGLSSLYKMDRKYYIDRK